jgi:hypothetical protein
MKSSKQQFEELRQQDINENMHSGVPMYNSAPKVFIPTKVYVKDINTIPDLLSAIQDALKEHVDLLNEVNKKHNRETLDSFWDYQTAYEAKEAIDKLKNLFSIES